MRTPSVAELLAAWEQGLGRPGAWQAIVLLAAACPGFPAESLAQLSIGRRDAGLLALRHRLFGPTLTGLAACPDCAERLEFTLDATALQVVEPSAMTEANCLPQEWAFAVDGYEVRFRMPDSYDLALLQARGDRATARAWLSRRCILAVQRDSEACSSDQLPEDVAEATAAQMGWADPQGNIELALMCPACGHNWVAPFDIASFLWAEVNAWALRMLYEVHVLARAYGWSQSEILALGPVRRQFYLEMVS